MKQLDINYEFEYYISICYSIFDQSIEEESETNKILIALLY